MSGEPELVGLLVQQYQRLIIRRIAELKLHKADELAAGAERAFLKMHAEIEKHVSHAEWRLFRRGLSRQVAHKGGVRFRVCLWRSALADLQDSAGVAKAFQYAFD